ncbi:ABC transporter permease [Agromyces silvae]|uniref:ABC transporter permease n=1 Tax=Agromyces silvae TaxID=3388266 RepID=UPI00280B6E2E|nr:iron ABC transporter permease [Agromyces protaetiae]
MRIVLAIVVIALVFLIAVPLWRVIQYALTPDGLGVLASIVTNPTNVRIAINTLVLGVTVGTVGTVVGFLFAFAQVRLRFRGKKLLHLIALLPIVSPPFAVATSLITLFGRNGMISSDLLGLSLDVYGLSGLTIVLSLSFFPVAYMNMKGMLESMDPALDEASSDLGGTALRTFRKVTLPLMLPAIAGSFLLLFVEAIADLANPLVIGGDYTVLAARAYLALTGEYNVPAAAGYSIALLLPALLVFGLQRYWVTRKNVVTITGKPAGTQRPIRDLRIAIPVLTIVVAIALFIILIYATVLIGGFVKILGVNNELTLDHYRYILLGVGSDATRDTVMLALIATPIAGILGMAIGWLVVRKLRRLGGVLDFVGMLGVAVPGTVLGIGYAVSYSTPVEIFGLQVFPALAGGAAILGGVVAIVMVFVATTVPMGQRAAISSLQQIHPAIDEAATSLGASGARTFRTVTLPLIRPALLTGLVSAFAKCMTLLSAIVFITTPSVQLMTAQILNEVESGRFGNAFAFCTLLIVIVLTVVGLMNLVLRSRLLVRGGDDD